MSNKIKNCEFRFKCPMDWDDLTETNIESKKFCEKCNKPVIFCETTEEFETAASNRDCVCVQIESVVTIGEPSDPYPTKVEKD